MMRQDALAQELSVPIVQHAARMARQRLQLEVEKLVDIERAGLVLLEKLLVAGLVDFAVEHAFLDQKLRPLEVAVAGQQGIVQIEKSEAHHGAQHAFALVRGTGRCSPHDSARLSAAADNRAASVVAGGHEHWSAFLRAEV